MTRSPITVPPAPEVTTTPVVTTDSPATQTDAALAIPVRHRGVFPSLLEGIRPRQWVKNLLVLSAPFASGEIREGQLLARVALALVCFTAAASATYLINDVRDAEADRAHPVKRGRPVARGDLPAPVALSVAGILVAMAVALPWAAHREALGVCIGSYVALTTAYSTWLKHQPVLDLAVVAAGFVLRAAAGGLAIGVPLSGWFLVIASFGSLFVVSGKRYSELVLLGGDARTRPSLATYTVSYLRFVWSSSAAVVLLSYCLWASDVGARWHSASGTPWAALSVAPFTVAVLRYGLEVDRGTAGAPEDVALGNRTLQALGAAWMIIFALGVVQV